MLRPLLFVLGFACLCTWAYASHDIKKNNRRSHKDGENSYWTDSNNNKVLTYANWTAKHDHKFLNSVKVMHPAPKLIFPGLGPDHSTHNWSYFDMIYVITLKGHENSRLKPTLFELVVKANIPFEQITVLKTSRDQDGVRGCYNAHRFVADHALSNGYGHVVVFEDDIGLSRSRFTADKLTTVVKFLQDKDNGAGWDVFFFSTMILVCEDTDIATIKKVQSLTTAAYAVNREAMENLVAEAFSGASVDAGFYANLQRSFGHYPMLMFQRDDVPSSIKPRRYDL